MIDTYKTIAFPTEEILFKEKNSKFYGYAFPIVNEDEVKNHIEVLRKKHSNAGHFCYAYQTGVENIYYRVNDDGEPNNSAGLPIYGQIQSFDVTNILIVVVRVFGGTKLGVGGLISAYKTAAQLALENATIFEEKIKVIYTISFQYKNMNKVMRIIKEKNLEMVTQQMNESCTIEIAVRKKNAEKTAALFDSIFEVEVKLKS